MDKVYIFNGIEFTIIGVKGKEYLAVILGDFGETMKFSILKSELEQGVRDGSIYLS